MTVPNLYQLFAQLGLETEDAKIVRFIESHQLPGNVDVTHAQWWNSAQAAFLQEALEQDSVWSTAADQLNLLLHQQTQVLNPH